MLKKYTYTNEFLGRIARSYVENNCVWAYDELSMGLYKIDIISGRVELLLNYLQIHKDKFLIISGLLKRENEVILVPRTIDDDWIVYRIKEKDVVYFHPILLKKRFAEVCQYDNKAYMIPEKVSDPILVISLGEMKCIKQFNNWYSLDDKKIDPYSCWGISINENDIFFPVVNRKYICKINAKTTELIIADIPEAIYTISVDIDGIWILPVTGSCIYQIAQTGTVINCIEVFKNDESSVQQFARIVAVKDNVFLFPLLKNNIYVYRKSEKDFMIISSKKTSLVGGLLMNINCSYWDYFINNEAFCLLPMRYRWTIIDLLTLEIKEKKLIYTDNYMKNCMKWYFWRNNLSKNLDFNDNGDNAIIDYIQLISDELNVKKYNYLTGIGKQIWNIVK